MKFPTVNWRITPATLARSIGLASMLLLLLGATAFASFTISAKGGWNTTTGKPDSCSTSEWLFVINGISGGPAPASISVTFNSGAGTFDKTFLNPPGSTAHYTYPVDSTNAGWTVVGATAVLQDGTTYNNFVLSHGSCGGQQAPPPPPPSGTPELDTLMLFAAGVLSVGGYAAFRRRRRAA